MKKVTIKLPREYDDIYYNYYKYLQVGQLIINCRIINKVGIK